MGQIQTIISLVLIAAFAVAIIGYAVNFAIDNNAAVDISQDAQISQIYTGSDSNLSQFNSDANNTYSSILSTTIAPGSQTAQSAAPFAITPASALGGVKGITNVIQNRIFGGKFGTFFIALISVIIFMLALYLYKTLRGFPD